jgi:hypothetical protein
MCHSAKAAALSANWRHGTRSACCNALCLLSRRTSRTRFRKSLFAIHDLFSGGGRDRWSKLSHFTNSSSSREDARRHRRDLRAAIILRTSCGCGGASPTRAREGVRSEHDYLTAEIALAAKLPVKHMNNRDRLLNRTAPHTGVNGTRGKRLDLRWSEYREVFFWFLLLGS